MLDRQTIVGDMGESLQFHGDDEALPPGDDVVLDDSDLSPAGHEVEGNHGEGEAGFDISLEFVVSVPGLFRFILGG